MHSIVTVYALPIHVASMVTVRYDLNRGLPMCLYVIKYQEHMLFLYFLNLCKHDMIFLFTEFCRSLSKSGGM